MDSKSLVDAWPNIVLFDLLRYFVLAMVLFRATIVAGQSVEGRWTTYIMSKQGLRYL
jgi:hypothetical protein